MQTELDYIVVGLGLAGINFCEVLRKAGKSFVVYDKGENYSSWVSGGLYNPVILKRLTLSWNANEQMERAHFVYKEIEDRLGIQLDHKLRVHKKFQSVEDLNNWVVASDKPHLKPYLNPVIFSKPPDSVIAPFGMGQVLKTGKIDTAALLDGYTNYLNEQGKLVREEFSYDGLEIKSEGVQYKDHFAGRIVFAEGFGLKKNPFFNSDKLKGNKGEVLVIEAPDLKIDFILKTDVFLIPIGNERYTVGATYNWEDKTLDKTEEAKEKLLRAAEKLINCDYKVVEHRVGMRPTTADRRPLVGVHAEHPQLALLNGLGTRGIMIGPTVAQQLFDHLEQGAALPQEININRFGRT